MKLENYFKLDHPEWVWWLGIIESRGDVTRTGRYQVRIFGYHVDDVEILPTKDLPYATVLNSVTNASTSGIMENPNLMPGSTVVGFFADGKEGQMPVILGSIAGKPASGGPLVEDAFNDPNQKFPRGYWGDKPEGFAGVDEPDISRLARDEDAETHFSLVTKRAEREVDVRTAAAPSVQGDGLFEDKSNKDYEGEKWDEPFARAKGPYKTFEKKEYEPKYWDALADLKAGGTGAPKEPGTYTSLYPFNQVKETEAGFSEEFDNTGNNFRYAMYHPSGNYLEHQHDGTKVEKIKGDDYEVVVKDKNVLIRGSCNVTIMGDCKMLVQGDKYEEVEGDYFLSVFGDRITKINGNDIKSVSTDENKSIGGNKATRVALDENHEIIQNLTQKVVGNVVQTVTGRVTEDYAKQHNTKVGKTRGVKVIDNSMLVVGGDSNFASTGKTIIGSGDNMEIETKKEQKITVAEKQIMAITGDQEITAAVSKVQNDMEITGTSTASTDHVSAGISGAGHTHPGDSGGNTGGPQ